MAFTAPNGTVKEYPRISVHRCFPFSDPDRYISIREPEADGKEIGLIEDIRRLPGRRGPCWRSRWPCGILPR